MLVERQNRLQLLQQNAAMYRENKWLQHLQDQNNNPTGGEKQNSLYTNNNELLEMVPRATPARLKLEYSGRQFRVFGRKTHLFETVNRKRNL